jgi:hypothetical protein
VTRLPAPWIDENIKYLMKCRDAAGRISRKTKTQQNIEKYKKLHNKVKQLIRNNKHKFLHNILNPKLPSNVLWNNIHKYGISNNNEFKIENNIQLDQINNYFSTLPYNIEFLSKLHTIQNIEDNCMKFYFPKFKLKAVSMIRKAFKRIKSTAIDVNSFPITFINWTLRHILPAVTHIFKILLLTLFFPVFGNELLFDLFPNAKIRLIFLIGVQFVYFQFFLKLWNILYLIIKMLILNLINYTIRSNQVFGNCIVLQLL